MVERRFTLMIAGGSMKCGCALPSIDGPCCQGEGAMTEKEMAELDARIRAVKALLMNLKERLTQRTANQVPPKGQQLVERQPIASTSPIGPSGPLWKRCGDRC